MAFDIQDVLSESKATKPSESTSLVGEAYGLLSQQQSSRNDQTQSASQSAVNQMFGSLELFDSKEDLKGSQNDTRREPTFKRDGPDPNRPETPFEPTPEFAGKVFDEMKKFDIPGQVKKIPGELNRQLHEIGRAWGFGEGE